MKYLLALGFTLIIGTSAMAKKISTEILIMAPPEKVWKILTDFDNYPNWNPFIKFVRGNVAIGSKIIVTLLPPGAKKVTFKPRVLILDANKQLKWIGHLLFPGLFDGKHNFELIDNGNGTTTVIQSEIFKGILVPLFKRRLDHNTKNGFELMNKKLKELAEQQ